MTTLHQPTKYLIKPNSTWRIVIFFSLTCHRHKSKIKITDYLRHGLDKKTKHIINPNIVTISSDWLEKYRAHIIFDRIIATTGAGHVLFRYDYTGALSKSFVEASLKRYGDTYECKNIKLGGDEGCLYFIRKKNPGDVKYESPLNYTGGKSRIIVDIKENLPNDFDSFIDMFGGGFNVGINIDSDKTVYNDINYLVKDIVESFAIHDTYEYLMYIDGTIRKFGLEKTNSETYSNVHKFLYMIF